MVPDVTWWRSAAVYQVYVRAFADGNGDGVGDLAGVRDRLTYLRDLGVDALWFTPWYRSPWADGGYDVADYRAIDPAFGTLAEAEQMIAEARALGMRTIVDIVPNHVSDQHPWFQAALATGPGSAERDWFWFRPGRGAHGDEPPNGWVSHFGGPAWTRTKNADGTPGDWYLHLFAPEQPDLNWDHPDVRREHEEILRFWFDRGVAGVRIDSAALLVKHPDLPEVDDDHAPGEHVYVDRSELHDIYARWRALADAYDEPRVLVGEVWVPDPQRMGLHYNRAMFEEAGLDPDEPPTSWDEVREDAKAIAGATGQAGYAEMTQDNTGGWILTTLTYSLGGRIQEGTGDDVSATVDNDATKEALQMLHDMRWEDDSMGDNFLFDWGSINQAFAAGQVGMYVTGSDVYNSLVTENDVKADEYGLTVLPLTDGDDAGVLGGGTIVGVKPDASDAERAAAVKWIDFFYMSKLTDQDAAVADAEALTASDGPLGTPTLPIFDEEHLAESDGWIADYVNVPLEQMLPFKDNILGQELVPEPPVDAQATYSELDTVVQAVLTDENADIDALLERANDNVESLIAAAA